MGFRIIVGLVTALTIFGSGYEMVLERRKAREFKRRQITQGNNNEDDSKAHFTLEKMHAMEKMHKECGNEDESFVEENPLIKSNYEYRYFGRFIFATENNNTNN